ncbi:MAG: EAL domain-containing protein [Lachnospiraceae bacterium]|nr:EAL domain-containing protein [Lachnospiraceae bacterium]
MRKRIAVLSAQLEEHKQKNFLTDFLKQAYELDYDVCLFSMYQKYQETELRNIGDSNIYELVPYEMFDAILFMPDTILVPGVSEKLLERIHEKFHGPVLVLELDNPYFPSVKFDHYSLMRKVVDHMIEVHGYEDIAFLGGKKGHPHSIQRLDAFMDSMKAHALNVRPECIFHGNYWYDSGKSAAKHILSLAKLPRALVCANDCMAIGAAAYLTEHGIRIPEDIAITGYESIDEGKMSPFPLTSAEIPAGKYGAYSMQWLHNALEGLPEPTLEKDVPIFVGGSCGCTGYDVHVKKNLRDEWTTVHSDQSYYSDFNHITEDLLSQTEFSGFYKVVQSYLYQIRPFKSFHLCLNNHYSNVDTFIGEQAIRKGYSDVMYRVIRCEKDIQDYKSMICANDTFETKYLLPELLEERQKPEVYVFNPLYFNDRCFGYSVVSYDMLHFRYTETYRIWMKSVMQGMEACYRQLAMQQLIEKMKATQIRDALTGLFNYQGFLQKGAVMYEKCQSKQIPLVMLSMDIEDLKDINAKYGRETGDRAIVLLSRILQENIAEHELLCRMCNDEFLVLICGASSDYRAEVLVQDVKERLNSLSIVDDCFTPIRIHSSVVTAGMNKGNSLEYLINSGITKKNHVKSDRRNLMLNVTNLSEEDIARNGQVNKLLNENLFSYHFQPLVCARDGSVFGYEALMRCEGELTLSAVDIIQGAACLGRLYDVEKATFNNVLSLMEMYKDVLGDRKMFINSLPAHQLKKDDFHHIEDLVYRFANNLVVEITEESELSDEKLNQLKQNDQLVHLEIALDDYGAGYSNINNLLRYMPKYVKIDQMLIHEIDKNPHKQHFVRSVIEFAHNNGIMVLAEGVKSSEELRETIHLNVDLLQGFYIATPKPKPVPMLDSKIVDEILRYQQLRTEWGIDIMQLKAR